MSEMKYVPVTKLWNLESWGVELGGLLADLSITVDSLADSYSNSAVKPDKILTE